MEWEPRDGFAVTSEGGARFADVDLSGALKKKKGIVFFFLKRRHDFVARIGWSEFTAPLP